MVLLNYLYKTKKKRILFKYYSKVYRFVLFFSILYAENAPKKWILVSNTEV